MKAFIVLRPGFDGSPELARELQDFVKAEIAPYKYPRRIEFVEKLPRTETGKLQRFRLRELGIGDREPGTGNREAPHEPSNEARHRVPTRIPRFPIPRWSRFPSRRLAARLRLLARRGRRRAPDLHRRTDRLGSRHARRSRTAVWSPRRARRSRTSSPCSRAAGASRRISLGSRGSSPTATRTSASARPLAPRTATSSAAISRHVRHRRLGTARAGRRGRDRSHRRHSIDRRSTPAAIPSRLSSIPLTRWTPMRMISPSCPLVGRRPQPRARPGPLGIPPRRLTRTTATPSRSGRFAPPTSSACATFATRRFRPDGKWVAYTVTIADSARDKNDTDVWMASWDGKENLRITSTKDGESQPALEPRRPLSVLPLVARRWQGRSGLAPRPARRRSNAPHRDQGRREQLRMVARRHAARAHRRMTPTTRTPAIPRRPRRRSRSSSIATTSSRTSTATSGDKRSHLYVFDVATKKLDAAHAREVRGGESVVVARRQVHRVRQRPLARSGQEHQLRHLRDRSARAAPRCVALTTFEGEDNNSGSKLAWSPDGKSIAYVRGASTTMSIYDQYRVAVIPVAGGAPKLLTESLDRPVTGAALDRGRLVAAVPRHR